jgi:hypothetical protein
VPRRKSRNEGCRAAEREQGPEIGVGGDDDAVLGAGTLDDLLVACRLEVVAAYVRGLVAGGSEALGEKRRECVVDQEPQRAGLAVLRHIARGWQDEPLLCRRCTSACWHYS